jgi:DNA/RNA endonuclease YhcR with UshA esterase domain
MKLSNLTMISLASSVVGLILIYIAAINLPPVHMPISSIDAGIVGRTASTTGYVTYSRTSAQGHLFLTISDNSNTLQVPLFAGYIQSAKIDTEQFKIGKKISVTGIVDQYQGQMQIVPQKLGDISVVG